MEPARKRLFIIVGAVFAGLLLIVLIISHAQSLSATLTITVAPSDSKITLNGKSAHSGVNKVQPGSFTVVASRSGFANATQTVSVTSGQNQHVGLVLVGNSPQTSSWYSTHPGDEQIAEGISSKNNDAVAQQAVDNAPLIKQLPYVGAGSEFRIDYGNQPGPTATVPIIYITGPSPSARQDALTWMRTQGFDPSDYNIQFKNASVQ